MFFTKRKFERYNGAKAKTTNGMLWKRIFIFKHR